MDLRKNRDVLMLVFEWALQDRQAMVDAVSNDPAAVKEVEKEIDAVRRMREKVFPGYKSGLDNYLETAQSVSITELRRMVERGEVENRADREAGGPTQE